MLFSGTMPKTAWVMGSKDGKSFFTIGDVTLYDQHTGIWVKDSNGLVSTGFLAEDVADSSYHGIYVTSTSGGETYEWASTDVGFDPSDIVQFGLTNGNTLTKTPLTSEVTTISNIAAGSVVTPGSYFILSSPSTQYYVWFTVDGVGTAPSHPGYETLYSWVFEGVDEAITWVEPNGPDPDYLVGGEIDTAQHYAGTSSLLLAIDGEVDYAFPTTPLLSDFTMTTYFRFHAIDGNFNIITMSDSTYTANIGVELSYGAGNIYIYISGRDTADNPLGDDYNEIISLAVDTWHKCEIIVAGTSIKVKINGVELVSWIALIDNPLAGLDSYYTQNQNYTAGNNVWIDNTTIEQSSSGALFLGGTGVQVDLLSTDTATQVAVKIAAVLDALDAGAVFDVPVPITPTIVITNVIAGTAVDPSADDSSGFTFGVASGTETVSSVVVIPYVQLSITCNAPTCLATIVIPCIQLSIECFAPTITGDLASQLANQYTTFPNLSGGHLSLTFHSSSLTDGLELYHMRTKTFRTVDRTDSKAVHPNLSGRHLSLKFSHSALEDLILSYVSVGIMEKKE